jgi:hypothetical protein
MNELFAFLNADELPMTETRGHYDADQQMWVGDTFSTATQEGENDTNLCVCIYYSDGSLIIDVDW